MWHYKDADPDLGQWQAKELLDHLEGVLSNEPVEVISGQAIVEVKPTVPTAPHPPSHPPTHPPPHPPTHQKSSSLAQHAKHWKLFG